MQIIILIILARLEFLYQVDIHQYQFFKHFYFMGKLNVFTDYVLRWSMIISLNTRQASVDLFQVVIVQWFKNTDWYHIHTYPDMISSSSEKEKFSSPSPNSFPRDYFEFSARNTAWNSWKLLIWKISVSRQCLQSSRHCVNLDKVYES